MKNQKPLCQQEVEKNLERKKMFGDKTEKNRCDIFIKIKNDSTKNECNDIGKTKNIMRSCPSCGDEILYSTVGARNCAERKQRKCKKCGLQRQSRIYSDTERTRQCPLCRCDVLYSTIYAKQNAEKSGKDCWTCSINRRNKSDSMRKAVSESKKGNKNHFYGLVGSENPANRPDVREKLKEYQNRPEIKNKRREVWQRMVFHKKVPTGPFYNMNACKFMDEWGPKNGYNFEHAMNGKELAVGGYWVDGYDKEKNIIFEYDEPYHFLKKAGVILKPNDVQRMHKIQKILKCDFVRYNELTKEIIWYRFADL